MRLKIDWASLIVGSKFTVFALFYFVFEGNFPITSPQGLIFGGAILRYWFWGLYLEGLIQGGAYFRNFTVFPHIALVSCFSLQLIPRNYNGNGERLSAQ